VPGQIHALRRRFGLLALIGAALVVTPLTLGNTGDLDPSFNGDGIATTDFGKSEFADGMVIQQNRRITVVGHDTETDPPHYYRDFVLARYLNDGSLDPAFGGGKVRTDFAGGSDAAAAVVEQSDGKLVVAGSSTSGPQLLQFALARYNDDASLDSTFDGDGMAVVSTGEVGVANAVALQPDGRIVAAGEGGAAGAAGAGYDFALARLTPTGSLDTSFDGDGIVLTDLSGGEDAISSVGVQADGKIVAGGIALPSRDLLLGRYSPDGSLDASFDSDGKVRTTLPCCAIWPRLALQPDGKILVAAGSQLLRYNSDGTLDSGFGIDGRVDRRWNTFDAVTVQPDGKIVSAGQSGTGLAVSRYSKDGSDDFNFTSNVVMADQGAQPLAGVGLQFDRKIVVAGSTGPDSGHMDFVVLRLLNPAPPAARCRVPNVRRKTLRAARRSITRARCTVGRVTRKPSGSVKKGRVTAQRPRAGRVVPAGAKVRLVISRGRLR
jgi:uncharacterized delta-60 repeat protein